MKKSDITKQRILEAAEREFSEKGFYGGRVDSIAAEAQINKRMLYKYCGSKEALYTAVLTEVYHRLAKGESALLREEASCEDTIRALIFRYFRILSENESFVRLVMWENLKRARYIAGSSAFEEKGEALTLLRSTLTRGIEEGVFRKDLDIDETILSMNLFCFSYFSNVHTMSHVMTAHFDAGDLRRRADMIADMILEYIINKEDK